MNRRLFSLLLVLVSAGVGVYFRFYPKILPIFDTVATYDVYGEEKEGARKVLKEKYPDLAPLSVDKIVEQLFKEKLHGSGLQIKDKIARKSQEYKNKFRDEEGHVYLSGIDSYYWLRLLNNLLKQGHIGDRVVNGVQYDDRIGLPIDDATTKNIHLWLGVVFYKTARFFNKDVPLEEVLFYIPIALSLIIAVFSFSVARGLGASDFGAFFASVAVNLSPFLISRSVTEWFDTDIYNVLFPLLAFGTFVFVFADKKWSKRLIFSALSGAFLACYATTWKGWWFIFDIMVFSCLIFILNQKLSQKDTQISDKVLSDHWVSLGLFFGFTSLFVIASSGFSVWKDFIAEPIRLSTVLKITPQAMWPNVYLTVAELGRVDPSMIVRLLGGFFFFLSALFGLIYIYLVKDDVRDNRFGFGLLALIFWIVPIFYISQEAVRFVLLLVVPLGLAFGLAVTNIYELVERGITKFSSVGAARLARLGTTVFFSAFLAYNVLDLHRRMVNMLPGMDDHWYNTLTKIEKETPKGSFIDSWWDFGHWFKSVADRRVLFDGMTQNTPYAYWIANVLLANSEEEAIGILRMINTSGNKAADVLEKEEHLTLDAVCRLIKEAASLDRKAAEGYLRAHLSEKRVQEIMGYLFGEKLPPVYLIVSYDMIGKVGPISYIGNWDFKKVDMWFKKDKWTKADLESYLIRKYNLTKQEVDTRYLEMSGLNNDEAKRWFSKPIGLFSTLAESRRDGDLLFFNNGLVVNLKNNHASVVSEYPEKRGVPKSLLYLENGKLKEEVFGDATLAYSALLVKDGDVYKSIFMDSAYAKSLMARLFFLKGEGLKYFKLWHREKDEKKGFDIYVYEVRWP
jgi:dolichyl-diphosphooligosaccharide--protein glycosyltransferase